MANITDPNNSETPELQFIPDQTIAAGRKVEISFYEYAIFDENDPVEFSIDDFPEGLTIDPKKGIVTGIAPNVELNQSVVVALTLTNLDTRNYAQAIFRLEIIGTLLLETPEGQAFFARKEVNLWDSLKTWEIQLFIQQLINEHFAWVMMYDATQKSGNLGKFSGRTLAKTGWEIVNFENAVMITPGNKAFVEYGNRGRLLDTLREAYQFHVLRKNWANVSLEGSDLDSIGKAWVVGKELNVPVDEVAPSDAAEINFYNLNRIYKGKTPSQPKPQLG